MGNSLKKLLRANSLHSLIRHPTKNSLINTYQHHNNPCLISPPTQIHSNLYISGPINSRKRLHTNSNNPNSLPIICQSNLLTNNHNILSNPPTNSNSPSNPPTNSNSPSNPPTNSHSPSNPPTNSHSPSNLPTNSKSCNKLEWR